MCPTRSTPISCSKTAALTRVLDCVGRGYVRYIAGRIAADKLPRLLTKFDSKFGIGDSPSQRITRRKNGRASALMVVFHPSPAEPNGVAEWLLLATEGTGFEDEAWRNVGEKPYPQFLGYELVRYATRGRLSWTWRRPAAEMGNLYALLDEYRNKQRPDLVKATLERIANQPGFHGVREQSKRLIEHACHQGYIGQLPHLFFVRKVAHGEAFGLG